MFKRDINDDSDGTHLTSFGIEFQTEEEAKENERSPSVALCNLCFEEKVEITQPSEADHAVKPEA